MTTHIYHFLSRVDDVYVMKDGEIIAGGSYDKIKDTREIKLLVKIEEREEKDSENNQGEKKNKGLIKREDKEIKQKNIPEFLESNNQQPESQIREQNRTGSIQLKTFWFYFSKGGLSKSLFVFTLFVISITHTTFSDWWAGAWIEESFGNNFSNSFYLTIYSSLILFGALSYIAKFDLTGRLSCTASFNIFKEMIWNVLRRKMSFFDTTPSGVILNRCIDDMEIVDYEYAINIRENFEILFALVAASLVSILGSLLMIPLIIIMSFSISYFFKRYLKCSVDLKRLYRISRSSVLNCVTEVIEGYPALEPTTMKPRSWRSGKRLTIFRSGFVYTKRWPSISCFSSSW